MNIPDGILKKEELILMALRALYRKYGYAQYKMRKFESYDLYAGNKDFLSSEQIIAFSDTDGTLLKVDGIGTAKLDAIRDEITLEEGETP